jgi:hypothetical protein
MQRLVTDTRGFLEFELAGSGEERAIAGTNPRGHRPGVLKEFLAVKFVARGVALEESVRERERGPCAGVLVQCGRLRPCWIAVVLLFIRAAAIVQRPSGEPLMFSKRAVRLPLLREWLVRIWAVNHRL